MLYGWDSVLLDLFMGGILSGWSFFRVGFCPSSHFGWDSVRVGFCPGGILSATQANQVLTATCPTPQDSVAFLHVYPSI